MSRQNKQSSHLWIVITAATMLATALFFLILIKYVLPQKGTDPGAHLQTATQPSATAAPETRPPVSQPPATEPTTTVPPSAEPQGEEAVVVSSLLKIRQAPTTSSALAGQYQKGDRIYILEQQTDSKGNAWGRTNLGWIVMDYVQMVTESPVTEPPVTEPPATESPEPAWVDNVLMEHYVYFATDSEDSSAEQAAAHPVFGSDIKRSEIVSITILDTLKSAPGDAWDVSYKGDGSVLAWVSENGSLYDLYIGAEGGINAPYPSHLFSGFTNVKSINLNKNLHTDYAENLGCMFYACKSLPSLDVSSLNTSSAIQMEWMFAESSKLTNINLKELNTASVRNFSYMFYGCTSLRELKLDKFNTSCAITMEGMFMECQTIRELDLSRFDTSQVENMYALFYNCKSLEKLDISGFNTSNVQDMSWMFYCCPPIEARHVQHFDTGNVTKYENFMRGTEWHSMFK